VALNHQGSKLVIFGNYPDLISLLRYPLKRNFAKSGFYLISLTWWQSVFKIVFSCLRRTGCEDVIDPYADPVQFNQKKDGFKFHQSV